MTDRNRELAHMAPRKPELKITWMDDNNSLYALSEAYIERYLGSLIRDLDQLASFLTKLPPDEGRYTERGVAIALRTAMEQWHGRKHTPAKCSPFDSSLNNAPMAARIIGEVFMIPTLEKREQKKIQTVCDWILANREEESKHDRHAENDET